MAVYGRISDLVGIGAPLAAGLLTTVAFGVGQPSLSAAVSDAVRAKVRGVALGVATLCFLLGGSIGLALRERAPSVETAGFDANPNVRDVAGERGLVGNVCDSPADAVRDADLVDVTVPAGSVLAIIPP